MVFTEKADLVVLARFLPTKIGYYSLLKLNRKGVEKHFIGNRNCA